MKPLNNQKKATVLTLRFGMLIPLALLFAAVLTSCFSYNCAKQSITDDLNDAMIAMANKNGQLWTQPDTIAALRQMYAATSQPLIYQASDVDFRHATLKQEAYFTLALVDITTEAPRIHGNKIASDSIMLVPEKATDGLAIQVQGFADCSMASVFAVSDQSVPGILFALSVLSMGSMLFLQRKTRQLLLTPAVPTLEGIRLTPMQRQLTQMLLDAPGQKVDKATLCSVLWDNKSNAEESLYTLVRRTKTALSEAGIEIICNRGESYELRVNR